MQRSVRVALCSFFLILSALTVQAADQPAVSAAPAPAQPSPVASTPAPAPLPAAKESKQPAAKARIGVVDINKVSTESALGKSAQAEIKSLQAKLQKQIETKRRQLDKFKADVERKLPTMSPAQREAKSKEFQKKVEEFQKFGMKAEDEMKAAQEKLTKGLFGAIEEAATALGKAKGLAAVTINRELLYLGVDVEPLDVSGEVVKSMDEKGKKK